MCVNAPHINTVAACESHGLHTRGAAAGPVGRGAGDDFSQPHRRPSAVSAAVGLHAHASAHCRAQKYPAPVAGTVPTNVPTMYPWQGKMGKNGEKWGGNGEKWGKMEENKETWVVQPVPFPPISSPFPPHFPPFSPIFPHFPPFPPIFPRELSPFSPIFPRELSPMRPPHSLVANLNLDFWPFQPLNFPFFHQAI